MCRKIYASSWIIFIGNKKSHELFPSFKNKKYKLNNYFDFHAGEKCDKIVLNDFAENAVDPISD